VVLLKVNVKTVTRVGILLALALVFQSIRLGQFFTGPAINAVLFIAAATVGVAGGVIIGAVTPWVALALGILNPVLAPAVPFIMLGNGLLVIAFHYLSGWNRYAAVVGAAIVKFLVLSGAVRFILALNPKLSAALQVPQLITALIGGALALVVVGTLERTGIVSDG